MKIRFYLATAIVALSWMGCSQEEATNEIMSGANVIQATIESSSRSAVTDAGVFSWTTGDEISLLDDSNNDTYTYSGTGNGFNSPVSGTVSTPVVAYYPANESHTTTEFYLPDTYGNVNTEYVASTNAAMIATPPTGDNTYAFMHLGGVMRFNVKNVPINADGFQFTVSGKKITGAFEVKSGTEKTIETAADPSSNNTVTILFKKLTEEKDMTFYVPMPTGTYEDYTVALYINGQINDYQDTSTGVNNTIARKTLLLMPTFTCEGTDLVKGEATVGVIDLEDGSQSATITDDAEVVVTPGTDADAIATLNYAPANDGSSVLSISDGSGATQSGDSEGKVLVSTATGTTVASCDINTPSMTVELSAAESGIATYNEVTALTANQTLIIGEGVTVKKLVLKGGNVELKGNVENIECEVATTITLGNDITLVNAMTFSKGDATITLNEKEIKCASGDVFIVTDGTLTIEGSGLVHASAENLGAASAVWAKESSKVIINGGTYKVGHDGASKAAGEPNWRNDCIYARDNASIEINGGEFEYTGEISTENFESDGDRFLLNCRNADYQAGKCSITVKGGTFKKFNPGATSSENPVANYVAAGYSSVAGDNDTYVVEEGIFNETALKSAIASDLQEIILDADITDLTSAITIPTGTTATINLNGYNITAPNTDVFIVEGTLTINDDNNEGIVTAGSSYPANGVCAVWAKGGTVTINGGYYKVHADQVGKRNDCIYAGHNADNANTAGNITINDGKFEYVWPDDNNKDYTVEYNGDQFLLNCANSDDSTTQITVNGGRFKNHVPSFENTGRVGEVLLGTDVNVYYNKNIIESPHSTETNGDYWYEVKDTRGNEDYIPV